MRCTPRPAADELKDVENIFNEALAYLKGRECAAEGRAALAPFLIKTTREFAELKEEQNVTFARDLALLSTQNFGLGKFKSYRFVVER